MCKTKLKHKKDSLESLTLTPKSKSLASLLPTINLLPPYPLSPGVQKEQSASSIQKASLSKDPNGMKDKDAGYLEASLSMYTCPGVLTSGAASHMRK